MKRESEKLNKCCLCNVVLDPDVDTIYVGNDLGDIVCDSCIYEFTSWSESLGTYYDTESKEVYFIIKEKEK